MANFEKYLNEKSDWKGDVTDMYEDIQRMRKQLKRMWKEVDSDDRTGKENKDLLKKVLGDLQNASKNIEGLKL